MKYCRYLAVVVATAAHLAHATPLASRATCQKIAKLQRQKDPKGATDFSRTQNTNLSRAIVQTLWNEVDGLNSPRNQVDILLNIPELGTRLESLGGGLTFLSGGARSLLAPKAGFQDPFAFKNVGDAERAYQQSVYPDIEALRAFVEKVRTTASANGVTDPLAGAATAVTADLHGQELLQLFGTRAAAQPRAKGRPPMKWEQKIVTPFVEPLLLARSNALLRLVKAFEPIVQDCVRRAASAADVDESPTH